MKFNLKLIATIALASLLTLILLATANASAVWGS
jgi:hypothetical protein